MKVIQKYILTLNFVKEKIINIRETHWSTKPSSMGWQIFFQEKSTYLENGANSVQVDILNM